MNTRLFEQWLENGRAAMAPVLQWQEITADTAQKLVRHNLAVAQDCVDFGTRQWQLLGEVKDPQKWAAEEGRIAAEFGQKVVDRTGDFFKIAKDTQDALGALADKSVKATVDSFSPQTL